MQTPPAPSFSPGNRTIQNGAPAPQTVRPNVAISGGRPSASTPAAPSESIDLDQVITSMVGAAEGVSDLLFVVGRPPQIEVYGKLKGVDIEGLTPTLTPPQVQTIAEKMMGDRERLHIDLKENGSCDTSY